MMRALRWMLGLGSLIAAILLLVPALSTWWTPLAKATAFLTYAALIPVLWMVTSIVAARDRERRPMSLVAALVAAVLTIVLALPTVERYGGHGTQGTTELRVISLNVEYGEADSTQLLDEATQRDADIVVLLELTPDYLQRLGEIGFTQRYPHWVGDADSDASGSGVFSRTPLSEIGRAATIFTSIAVGTQVRGADWVIAGVHPVSPYFTASVWDRDAAAIRDLVAPLRAQNTLVIGDFNAVSQHYTMQRLYELGYSNAVQQTGAGWQPTWPMEKSYPPLVDIDHALTSPTLRASRLDFFTITGTDHRGISVAVTPVQ